MLRNHTLYVHSMLKGLLVVCMLTMHTTGFAVTRLVPNTYATISAAVAAASNGDTIRVFSGVYTEHVNINKSLVLLGSGPDTAETIIAAPADFESSFAYTYSLPSFVAERTIVHIGGPAVITVVMRGFIVDGKRLGPQNNTGDAYSGVLAERTILTFSNNTIKNVLPADSSSTYAVTYNGRGITARGDSSVVAISNNILFDINRFHIYVNATDTTTILPATFPTATVSNNTITGKGVYDGAQKGIWFNNGAWGTISGNTITNMDYINAVIESDRATAIAVRRGFLNPAKRNLVLGNTVTTTSHTNNKGIFVEGQKDSIADNTVSGFRFGIQLDDQDSACIVRNTVTGGQIGIVVATTSIAPIAPYVITIGGSPSNKNTITGQDTSSIGAAIALSFRDALADGTFMSTVPVNAQYNDFGVYSESAIRNRIWDRADTTVIGSDLVDTVHFSPFYVDKIRASVKVFLQGPYVAAGDSMSKALNTGGQLASHFGATPPTLAVDSINIELRNATSAAASTTRKFSPAWLMTDGTIRSFSDPSKSYVEFDTTLNGQYYLVIRHRNHLGIMCASSQALDGSTSPTICDFSTAQAKAFGTNPMAQTGSRFSLFAGDANTDGQVTSTDFNVFNPQFTSAATGYRVPDWNLDGQVTSTDFNLFNPNFTSARTSQIP